MNLGHLKPEAVLALQSMQSQCQPTMRLANLRQPITRGQALLMVQPNDIVDLVDWRINPEWQNAIFKSKMLAGTSCAAHLGAGLAEALGR